MKVEFRNSFLRDLRGLRGQPILTRIRAAIEEAENSSTLNEISQLTRLQGGGNFYRIRVSDYRLGLIIEDDIIIFVRCLHRREIYRYFP